MAYYNTCDRCGCNLDPGERCTCEEDRQKEVAFAARAIRVERGGQYRFDFSQIFSGGYRPVEKKCQLLVVSKRKEDAVSECKMCRLPVDVEYQCITEDPEVRIYLSTMRSEEDEDEAATNTWWEIMRALVELFFSFSVTYFVGKWAIAAAYAERGYKAYGGEYFLILFAFVISYKVIHRFFENYRR